MFGECCFAAACGVALVGEGTALVFDPRRNARWVRFVMLVMSHDAEIAIRGVVAASS
jgi:hypothetical protein